MPLIRVDGLENNPVLAGFQWETISKKDLGRKKKEAKLENHIDISQRIKSGGGKKLAFGVAKKPEQHGHQLVSLAAWLNASIEGSTVFAVEKITIEDSEKEAFWLCVVNSGEIISGTDIIESWDVVNETATDLLDAFDGEDCLFVGNAAKSLDVLIDQDNELAPLAEVLVSGRIKSASLKNDGSKKALAVIGSAIALVLAIGLAGYAYYAKVVEEQAQAEKARQQQIMRVQAAQQQWASTLEDAKRRSEGEFVLSNLVRQKVMKLQPNIGGWALTSLDCNGGQCEALYENQNLTRTEFVVGAIQPNCEQFTIDRPGLVATCNFTYAEKAEKVDISKRDWLLTETQWDELRSSVMDLARLNGSVAYSLSVAQEINFPGKGLVQGAEFFDIGSFSITFPWSSYPAIESLFYKYPGMSALKVELEGGQNIFTISGLLYQESSK
jgi:hypothetical protein